MTKGRKTTLDERIEIVSYCMEHGKDYQLTCQKYAVSYNQLYSWVRKYEEKGSRDWQTIVGERSQNLKWMKMIV